MIYRVEVHEGKMVHPEIVVADSNEAAVNAALSRHPVGAVSKGVYPASSEEAKEAGEAILQGVPSLTDALDLDRSGLELAAAALGMVTDKSWTDTMLRVAVAERVAIRRGEELTVSLQASGSAPEDKKEPADPPNKGAAKK